MIHNMSKWILVGAVLLAVVLGGLLLRLSAGSATVDAKEISWELLAKMDYVSGAAPPELKELDGKVVKMPGFMVPLEDEKKNVTEFLLVPTPQACIHVPPPPPNQMIYVKMNPAVGVAYGPIWTVGTLRLTSKKHMYGEASFELEGTQVEAYH